MYVYTQTYIQTDAHIHIHAYIHIYIHTCIHTYMYTYIHTYICTYVRTYVVRAYVRTYVRACDSKIKIQDSKILHSVSIIFSRQTRKKIQCKMNFFLNMKKIKTNVRLYSCLDSQSAIRMNSTTGPMFLKASQPQFFMDSKQGR